jgi:hypothetical protein
LEAGATKRVNITSNYTASVANIFAVVYLKASSGEILQAALVSD